MQKATIVDIRQVHGMTRLVLRVDACPGLEPFKITVSSSDKFSNLSPGDTCYFGYEGPGCTIDWTQGKQ